MDKIWYFARTTSFCSVADTGGQLEENCKLCGTRNSMDLLNHSIFTQPKCIIREGKLDFQVENQPCAAYIGRTALVCVEECVHSVMFLKKPMASMKM